MSPSALKLVRTNILTKARQVKFNKSRRLRVDPLRLNPGTGCRSKSTGESANPWATPTQTSSTLGEGDGRRQLLNEESILPSSPVVFSVRVLVNQGPPLAWRVTAITPLPFVDTRCFYPVASASK